MTPTVLVEYTQQRDLSSRSSYPAVMMSKTQRISKVGHNSGFVPDYRLAVETVGESEGFGSSCREDTEMTASEDSCAPRRKCISLNGDGCDRFGVPIQVLSVSKLSRPDRKKLELKLRTELEQIRVLQKRTAARLVNGVALSSSNDVQSSDGQKKNLAGNIQKPYESLTGHGKKRPAPSRSGGAPPKRGASGRFESVNHESCPPSQTAAILGSSNAALFKQCESLLKKMMSHQFGWVFNTPVDVVKLNIPDYFNIIKHPMDLGTVNTKIESGSYSSPLDFAADVRLTFSNAKTYNPSGNDVHYMADTLSKFFEVRWRAIEKKIPVIDQPPRANAEFSEKKEMSNQSMQKKKLSSAANKTNTDNSVKRIMTDSEKQKLTKDLEGLEGEIPEHIVNFLKFHCQNASEMAEDEIELDIEALSDDTLFKLRTLIDDHLQGIKASQAKAEPSEVEVLNESGVSNSSMQPCKDNDPADEDVDICGNDPLVSSRFPPVEIEKDTAQRNSKCSSSSSSSDSGSSTSDSDTGSSSGSESDQAKTSSAVHDMKDTAVSDAALDQEQSVLLDPLHRNHSLGVVDQDDETNIRPVDGDGRQEGENAPSERQVSPEKLYRAAVLLGRFADTILKAREKTLNQGERGDPEKLRLEREELEKQQREERARLQAEAKAAEDARKQAEAEAAAEARRKRELEREAARLALQQMQKTVEISENSSQFLKDLEMMGSVPAEHIPSSLDETSPEHSFEGMGSFKLGKSNPLEQLGLYMKADDEEEEDDDGVGAHISAPVPNDVEEGEID